MMELEKEEGDGTREEMETERGKVCAWKSCTVVCGLLR